MAARTYYPYPPMPQRSIPPQVKTPIFPADLTGDQPGPVKYPLSTILSWYRYKYPVPQRNSLAVPFLIPIDVGTDAPLASRNVQLFTLIRKHYTIPKANPVQRINLNPALIPNPEDTIPLPQSLVNRFITIQHWIAREALYKQPRQKPIFFRGEIAAPPASLFVGRLIAFQPNAFQIGYPGHPAFQGFNRALKIRNVSLFSFLTIEIYTEDATIVRTFKKGASVVLKCKIYDPTTSPGILVDPDAVLISIMNPDETILIDQRAMSRITTGDYTYIHQTLTGDQSGPYLINIFASIASNSDKTLDQLGFILE